MGIVSNILRGTRGQLIRQVRRDEPRNCGMVVLGMTKPQPGQMVSFALVAVFTVTALLFISGWFSP
jgi:hypothetical protein